MITYKVLPRAAALVLSSGDIQASGFSLSSVMQKLFCITNSRGMKMRNFKKLITTGSVGLLLGAGSTLAWADVASRVQESNSTTHKGVLAYVHDTSAQGRKTERAFFGEGLSKVSAAAPGFQIQIVEREDIPGGALPGSFVVLTPSGDRVVAMQRGYNTIADLRAFVAGASAALGTASPAAVAFFEYDR